MAFLKSKNNLSDHVIKLKKELDSLDVNPESLIPPYILAHFKDRAKYVYSNHSIINWTISISLFAGIME